MNVALPAVILFFILVPGFLFRSNFKLVERSSLDYSPFGAVVLSGLFWAVVLHGLWLISAYIFFDRVLSFKALLGLMSPSATSFEAALRQVESETLLTAVYFLTIVPGAVASGRLLQRLVTRLEWDRGATAFLFRFTDAPWHYLLTGRDGLERLPDLIKIAAVVDVGGTSFVYAGYLVSFHLTTDGSLDRLILRDPVRRPLARDKDAVPQSNEEAGVDPSERFYQIDSDMFVLKYESMSSLNVEYMWFVTEEGTGSSEASELHAVAD